MEAASIVIALLFSFLVAARGTTDPADAAVISAIKEGLENPEALKWPAGNDPCGSDWPGIFCQDDRVTQIQLKDMELRGTLPKNLNQLAMLQNLGLQRNQFTGAVPSLSGLRNLKYAYFDYNNFDTIPPDFFRGLDSLEALALDDNDFNATTGWMFSEDLLGSLQLMNLSCMRTNLAGPLPDFLGNLSSLTALRLSGNRLTGTIPAAFSGSSLQILWLNNQDGAGMTGPIDVVATMESLTSLWLHGNQFTGPIPAAIGNLTVLKDFNVNGNKLVGLIPDGLADLALDNLDLNNNQLMGPIPKFKARNAVYKTNSFCQSTPGVSCDPQVIALLYFLQDLNYPARLVSSWGNNDPCQDWLGLACSRGMVTTINLPHFGLSGTLSPSLAKLDGLTQIRLANNNLSGPVPDNWTDLKSLQLLDLSHNNISSPVPKFAPSVKIVLDGIALSNATAAPPSTETSPSPVEVSPLRNSSSSSHAGGPVSSRHNTSFGRETTSRSSDIVKRVIIPTATAAAVGSILLVASLCVFLKKKKGKSQSPNSLVVHPREPSDPDNVFKIVVANNCEGSHSNVTGNGSGSITSSGFGDANVIESGNLVISVQVLRNVTNNFSPKNELGRGGFGVVYKGELYDGTKIAVKRMEAGVISSKALDEFQSEIAVLSKVRHRHLVSLLGYSTEGSERILVYEYMPQGALSKHLFHWKSLELEPLSWKRRLNIALDVARGMEYLHNLAHQSFIHRDLKSSNILLGDDFRAKVSDFGLVKLAPDGEKSVVTRLAGTFGYLAPEYAVTGKITTKVDVFSFGVVLMELLTGLMALDENRPEEKQYLASWFWHIKSDKEKLRESIDPALDVKEETFESIAIIAELAGHCTAREPGQRPDMSHAVNVLAPLVEKWKPLDDDTEEYAGIDYSLPLHEMVKDWQKAEGKDVSYMDLEDSKGSIPARPTGFAESFTSADGR